MAETLFGLNPEDIQAQRQAATQAQAAKYASMSPAEQVNYGGYMAGNQLGNALMGMMGAKDPEIERATLANKLAQETDFNDLDSVKALVGKLNQAGATREAMSLLPRIDSLTKIQEDRTARREDKAAAIEAKREEVRIRGEQRLEELKLRVEADLQRAREMNASREQIALMMSEARKQAAQIAADTRLQMAQFAATIKGPSAAQLKAEEAKKAKEEGQQSLGETLDSMKLKLDEIAEGGGMASTASGPLKNLAARTASSPFGQAVGGFFGTTNQKNRDVYESMRKQVLADVMKATGQSSKQLDSNVELQNALKALGSTEMTVEANKEILDNLYKKYVKGGTTTPTPTGGATGGWSIKPKTN